MAEDTARALGAAGAKQIVIAGKEVVCKPLTARDLAELERMCLQHYRRSRMEGYVDNLDLLPADRRDEILQKKFEEVANLDISSLPTKHVYDPDTVVITPELKAWLAKTLADFKTNPTDTYTRRVTVTAMEMGALSEAEIQNLTKSCPRRIRVSYVNWWVSGCLEGQLSMVWVAVRTSGLTREVIERELGDRPTLLAEIARAIEDVSAPSSGNG